MYRIYVLYLHFHNGAFYFIIFPRRNGYKYSETN